ncbi:GNAT family N-acetyltransferase [Kineosporia rhizophila]|uniref:GNAT family N-acetyltransferase n=1 Tax=Kineosporia rhizophila TaxID=84633 RepID=UPI001E5B14D0|nr:GNAT family N-acetyltransferase [Kineosporia rhizophila]
MITLRTARPGDLDAVLAFWQVAAENDNRPADSATAPENLLARDPEALVLALDDDTVVGSVIAGFDGWRYHLYRLSVAPGHRRQGIATALLEHAENRFRALGATRSDAMVLDENVTAQSAWWARGYRVQEDWSRWIKPL